MKINWRMAAALCLAAAVGGYVVEARTAAQDLPAKLTGAWVLNRELSTGLMAAPGRGRGGAPSQRPLFAVAGLAPAQRGGGGGGGGISDATDQTPEQRAARAAMTQLEQISERITIKASATDVTFVDGRGERTFTVNDKTSTIDVGGAKVKVRSKWDKQTLKQEFSTAEAKLTDTWSIDGSDHLVLVAKLESMTLNLGAGADRPTPLVTPDRRFVYDRH